MSLRRSFNSVSEKLEAAEKRFEDCGKALEQLQKTLKAGETDLQPQALRKLGDSVLVNAFDQMQALIDMLKEFAELFSTPDLIKSTQRAEYDRRLNIFRVLGKDIHIHLAEAFGIERTTKGAKNLLAAKIASLRSKAKAGPMASPLLSPKALSLPRSTTFKVSQEVKAYASRFPDKMSQKEKVDAVDKEVTQGEQILLRANSNCFQLKIGINAAKSILVASGDILNDETLQTYIDNNNKPPALTLGLPKLMAEAQAHFAKAKDACKELDTATSSEKLKTIAQYEASLKRLSGDQEKLVTDSADIVAKAEKILASRTRTDDQDKVSLPAPKR